MQMFREKLLHLDFKQDLLLPQYRRIYRKVSLRWIIFVL